jgi:hypothetical protein
MIPIPGKLYVIGAAVLALGLVLAAQEFRVRYYKSEVRAVQQELINYQAAAAAALIARLEENQKQEASQAARIEQEKRKHESSVASIRSRYDAELRRLRDDAAQASGGGALSEDSPSSGGVDAGTGEERFVAALQRCEEDRETLRSLQQWAKGVTNANP